MKVMVAASEELASQLEKALAMARVDLEIATSAADALTFLEHPADVTLLDYEMPGLGGLRGVQMVRAKAVDRAIGVVTPMRTRSGALQILAAGATGLLPVDADPETLSAALILLGRNQPFIIFDGAVDSLPQDIATGLSDREMQVLRGLCDGMQNKEIAHQFGIREVTAKMHVRAVIRKLGARNRTHAAMIACDLGLV